MAAAAAADVPTPIQSRPRRSPNLAPSAITRKTDKGQPLTRDSSQNPLEADGVLLAGAEDLAPLFRKDEDGSWLASQPANHGLQRDPSEHSILAANHQLLIHEERADAHWRAMSRDDSHVPLQQGNGVRDLQQRRLAIDKGMVIALAMKGMAIAVAVAAAMAVAAALALGPWSGGPL
jgi:hypothetical protein